MVAGHGSCRALQLRCSSGDPLVGRDRTLRGHSMAEAWRGYGGDTPMVAHTPWQLPPLDNWQTPSSETPQIAGWLPSNSLPSVPSSAQYKNWD